MYNNNNNNTQMLRTSNSQSNMIQYDTIQPNQQILQMNPQQQINPQQQMNPQINQYYPPPSQFYMHQGQLQPQIQPQYIQYFQQGQPYQQPQPQPQYQQYKVNYPQPGGYYMR